MAKQVLLATRNEKKRQELADILGFHGIEVLSLRDFPQVPEVEETGSTFEENALLKARTVCSYSGKLTLADDSGLEVDALGGQPGVHSARFAGPAHDDQLNNARLLAMLEGMPMEARTARFHCVIAIITPAGKEYVVRGKCEGRIALQPAGENGFGYDPLFIPAGYEQTFAQLGEEIKHRISHRARALALAAVVLKEITGEEK